MIEEILNYIYLEIPNKRKYYLLKEELIYCCKRERNIFNLYRDLKLFESELIYLSEEKEIDTKLAKRVLNIIKIELEIITMKARVFKGMDNDFELATTSKHRLKWTDSKTDLVELIYAIQGSIKDGKESIKNIVACFEEMFQINLGNIYDTMNEISIRKKCQTKYIDRLKERFCRYLDKMNS